MQNNKRVDRLTSRSVDCQTTCLLVYFFQPLRLKYDVEIGSLLVSDVRLRASETDDNGEMLIVPKVGTAVIVGSLSGDYANLVVLSVDHVESITINGGKLGGLVNIEDLTKKINELIKVVNNHTHQGTHGPTGPPLTKAQEFKKTDYEDVTIKH